jgi:hypothetical protein
MNQLRRLANQAMSYWPACTIFFSLCFVASKPAAGQIMPSLSSLPSPHKAILAVGVMPYWSRLSSYKRTALSILDATGMRTNNIASGCATVGSGSGGPRGTVGVVMFTGAIAGGAGSAAAPPAASLVCHIHALWLNRECNGGDSNNKDNGVRQTQWEEEGALPLLPATSGGAAGKK